MVMGPVRAVLHCATLTTGDENADRDERLDGATALVAARAIVDAQAAMIIFVEFKDYKRLTELKVRERGSRGLITEGREGDDCLPMMPRVSTGTEYIVQGSLRVQRSRQKTRSD